MIVEAGVTLAEAQEAALGADRLFPLSLAAEGTCTIGGNLSTNAGGVAVIAYGNARDLTTGIEVVLADGRIVNALSKLRKDNTGYDLKNLFIGAEGTLGVITAAALKLFPRPRSRATAFVGLADPAQALALLALARERFGQGVTSFELMPRIGLDFAFAYRPAARDPLGARHAWYVLIEVASQIAERPRGGDDRPARRRARARDHRGRERSPRRSSSAPRSGAFAKRCPTRRSRRAARSSTTFPCRSAPFPLSSARRARRWRRSCPARAWSPSVTSATATSTSTSAQPVGADTAAFLDAMDGDERGRA